MWTDTEISIDFGLSWLSCYGYNYTSLQYISGVYYTRIVRNITALNIKVSNVSKVIKQSTTKIDNLNQSITLFKVIVEITCISECHMKCRGGWVLNEPWSTCKIQQWSTEYFQNKFCTLK